MEELPDELRTPPVGLIALVGMPEIHPTISNFLHSEQPPINSLALPDFSKISVISSSSSGSSKTSSKVKDPLSPARPAGILKKDWLSKHRTRVPAVVAALFASHQVSGDPTQWLQVCTDLENIKAVISGKNIKLVVVLVQSSTGDDVGEDRLVAIRKRAEIDAKCLSIFIQKGSSEFRQSLVRLGSLFTELSGNYYKEEGRRVRTIVERKNFHYEELLVRYCFKVAVYAEFRRDWAEALKYYEDAYHALRELVGSSTRLPPLQRLVEIKAVAEQLHFKISALLLHRGKAAEAITWFWQHISSYMNLKGEPKAIFLHSEWMSRQFLVFAALLETSSAVSAIGTTPLATLDRTITELEVQPAYYYQLAARCLKDKKIALDVSISLLDPPTAPAGTDAVQRNLNSVVPSLYVGQFALLLEDADKYNMQSVTDAEYLDNAVLERKRLQDSSEVITLLRRSHDLFKSSKANRRAAHCCIQMAKEYFIAQDFGNAKSLFDEIAGLYRQEGWVTLLWTILGYLRDCSRALGMLKDYIEYSLEMAALPVMSSGMAASLDFEEYGPAGPANLLQREIIQGEIAGILRGEPLMLSKERSMTLNKDNILQLEIDVISPLRSAFLASVAFHDQAVKPGTPCFLTLSLQSQLPHPFEVDELEIQFNQPSCNFTIKTSSTQPDVEEGDKGNRVVSVPSLVLLTKKWTRLTHDVTPGQSGKLECSSVIARIGNYCIICFRVESPASMEDPPLWKYENRIETLPAKDPILAYTGQKVIQVEDPEPLVDLDLSCPGPALIGEIFPVSLTVTSKGHMVCSGELKINLVDSRGGLFSPREAESLSEDAHHVELLSISGSTEEKEQQQYTETIQKIHYSFGLLSVPFLNLGESWSCRLDLKWHKPKSVMLYVSLGYSPDGKETMAQQVHVHKSLQIEGKNAVAINHQLLKPFRRDSLLPSMIKRAASGSGDSITLARDEGSILIVSTKNTSEVPLKLLSIVINKEESARDSCDIVNSSSSSYGQSEPSSLEPVLMPGQEYKSIFSVIPHVTAAHMNIGTVCVQWRRNLEWGMVDFMIPTTVSVKQKLPDMNVEKALVVVNLDCPPYAVVGVPFSFSVRVRNHTALVQEMKYKLLDSQSFLVSGAHDDAVFLLPHSEHSLPYTLVPLLSGTQQLPQITLTSERYLTRLQPSVSATTLFVFPSKPHLTDPPSTGEVVVPAEPVTAM